MIAPDIYAAIERQLAAYVPLLVNDLTTFERVAAGTEHVSRSTFYGTNFETVHLLPVRILSNLGWPEVYAGRSWHTNRVLYWVKE